MPARGTPSSAAIVVLAITAIAALSLLLPFAPVFDTWAWLVWGREVTGLDLDTTGGPSWKPLPVVFTAVFSAAGDAAPSLWLLVARAAWLAVPVLAFRLATRLAPERLGGGERIAAGAIAAAGVLLLHDPFTSWLRQFAGGLSEPLLVALVLGTVDRHLARRPGQALALGAAAALLRPEAWPFLTLYLAWLWRERALRRGVLAAVTLAVPALWAVPDLLGSGDALTGASRARSSTGAPLSEALEAAGRSLDLAVWGLWAGAAYAFYSARRRDDAAIVTLALAAAAWIAIVAVMAAFGYAGLPRFAAPAAAIGCILGAVGIIELAGEVRRARSLAGRLRSVGLGLPIWGRRYRRAVAGAVAVGAIGLALGVQGAIRIADAPRTLEQASAFGDEVDSLSALVEETGRERLGACDAIETTDLYTQTALAWELERPLDRVGLRFDSLPASGVVLVGAGASGRAAELARARGETIARNREWTAYAVSCASASGSRIAGVAGARR